MPPLTPKALIFDVFGTCVDWRGSIIAEGRAVDRRWGTAVDWPALADAWRGRYQPALEEVRSGRRPWTILDVLHRESLDALAPSFGLDKLDEAQRDHLNRVWHRLTPWPDTVAGLTRLKRRFVIGPLSNGNFAARRKDDRPEDHQKNAFANDFEDRATRLGRCKRARWGSATAWRGRDERWGGGGAMSGPPTFIRGRGRGRWSSGLLRPGDP